jgi:hypothetical protein
MLQESKKLQKKKKTRTAKHTHIHFLVSNQEHEGCGTQKTVKMTLVLSEFFIFVVLSY